MGEATLDVEQCYRALGLAPMQGELPDHASVELAFLGSLANTEAEARASRNTTWRSVCAKSIAVFCTIMRLRGCQNLAAALTAGGVPLYAVVGNWLSAFLQEEMVRSSADKAQARSPATAAERPPTVRFVGLCTGRCATGALRILEDAHETRLALIRLAVCGLRPLCGHLSGECARAWPP